MNIYHFLNKNNIKTSYISKTLKDKRSFKIIRNICKNENDNIILIGICTNSELNKIKKYKKKVIYWNKSNIVLFNNKTKDVLLNNNIIHISDDFNVYNKLLSFNIKSLLFEKFNILFNNNIQIEYFNKNESCSTYTDINKDVIFYNPNNIEDIDLINKHKSTKYLFWNDDSILDQLLLKLNQNNLYHITNSKSIYLKLSYYKLNPIHFNFNEFIKNKGIKKNLFNKTLVSNKKINLIKIKDKDNDIKGINIDIDLINYYLKKISINTNVIYLDKCSLSNRNMFLNFSLNNDIYIFSEYLLYELFIYLLDNNKVVILIPNIDAHKDRCFDNWNSTLLKLIKYENFFIWSKTNQIYEWINDYYKKSNSSNNNVLINYNNKYVENQTILKYKNKLLLDTGSSTSERKYLIEILDLFANNIFPFHLVVKTVPNIYSKYKLNKYEKIKNISFINKIYTSDELDKLYKKYKYLIYLSKYDAFGLTLSKAIANNMFIFSCNKKPWSEMLYNYPRKCYINSKLKENKDCYNSQKINIPDLYDLKKKLYNFNDYESIIENTQKECEVFNINKYNLFVESLFNFFKNKIKEDFKKINKKTIMIDCQPLQHETAGLGTYGINLSNEIINQNHFNVIILINNFLGKSFIKNLKDNFTLAECDFKINNEINNHDRYNLDINEEKHELKLAKFIEEINPDIFLNLSEIDRRKVSFKRSLLKKSNIKTYSIHHDIIPIRMNKKEKNTRHYLEKLNNLKQYDVILTNSNFTKLDSKNLFKNIYHISTGFTNLNIEYNNLYNKNVLNKFSIKKKYIFYQSRYDIYKGFDKLCMYYSALPKNILDNLNLVLGTNKINKNNLLKILSDNKINEDKLIVTGYLSNDELTILHKNSWIFVHNSDYEGFGMSILDAWYNNKPVIVNYSSSLKEIMNNKDFCYNNQETFVKLIKTLYSDNKFYEKCKDHGSKRIEKYTWNIVYNNFYDIICKKENYNNDNKIENLKKKISFILCIKNNEKWLKYFEEKIQIIERSNNFDLEFFIYENNSFDNTKNILSKFILNRNGKVYFDDLDKDCNLKGISNRRAIYMSSIRNELKKKHGNLSSDYVIILDSNITFTHDIIEKFIKEYENNSYAMITPFTECKTHKNHYYDSLAFISKDNISMKQTGNTCLFKECTRCFKLRKKKNIILNDKYLLDPNITNEISTAFGCCAFLKTSIYNNCNWNIEANKINETFCEHIPFCDQVRKFGKIIVTNKIKLYNLCNDFSLNEQEYYDKILSSC